ncbi:MAG TPA: threonine/homoserine exporter RhtA [Steroidobacteraceae bacterium]|jgi:inner membrane transporter RhtA|nr:threonine/homoserine exporter RhtA [Steroidobacteraceae bacterium]
MKPLVGPASNVFPVIVLLLAMASFQVGASIAKTMFPLIGAIGMVTVRTVLGTVILAITLKPWRARIAPGSRQALVLYGMSLGLMNLAFYMALSRIPLGIAVAVEFSGPLAVAVVNSRRAWDFCWVVLAIGGMLLLLPIGHPGGRIDPVGILYALGAGACWALYIIFGRKAGAGHGVQTVALGSIISTIVIAPIGLVTAGSALWSRSVLLPGLAVAVLSTALPYTLEMLALTRLPARTYGVLMSVDPALAALFGLVFLNEHLSGMQWVAIILIIGASIGTTVTVQQKVPMPG